MGPISNRRKAVRKNLANYSNQKLGQIDRKIIDKLNLKNHFKKLKRDYDVDNG